MEELVVSAHEFESFSKWYRYREPVVSGCVQGVSSTRNIQIELEFDKVSKNGEVKKGIYDNTELIRDAEEFGCNLAKYSDAFRSQNQSFIGKKSKKASEYKPMLSERIEELKKQGNDTDIVVNLAKSWKTADYSRKKEVAMIMINKIIISENGDTKIIWNI